MKPQATDTIVTRKKRMRQSLLVIAGVLIAVLCVAVMMDAQDVRNNSAENVGNKSDASYFLQAKFTGRLNLTNTGFPF